MELKARTRKEKRAIKGRNTKKHYVKKLND